MNALKTWFVPRRDWKGARALIPVDTCYRVLDLCLWTITILGALAVGAIFAASHGSAVRVGFFWCAVVAVTLQLLAAVLRGLPFLVRYGAFAFGLLAFLLSTTIELGIPPNWSFLVILLLASTGLLFGTLWGLAASGILIALHAAVAWGWVTGRLPPISSSRTLTAADNYSNFHLPIVWIRVLVMSTGFLAALQLLMKYVLGDMNRALGRAETALRSLTAEQALRTQTERKFTAIFNQSPDICGIVRVRDGCILDVNLSFEALTGWTRAEALGRTTLDLGLWADASGRDNLVALALERGEVNGRELAWINRAGNRRLGLLSMRAMEIEGEQVLNIVVRDITAARKEQDRVRALEAQLNQSQQMESLGVLAGGIAHDFNNILTGLLGFTELARLTPGDTAAVGENIEEIHKAGLRAKDLVAQILKFTRQSQGAQVPLELSGVVADAISFLRASTPATIAIEKRLVPGCVRADQTQIHRVVLNLATNGIQAMRDRPGTLAITLEHAIVDAHLARKMGDMAPGAFMRLTVSDSGHGMTPATAERIFDPFFTTKAMGEGTGLGLAVVHGILRAHHGGVLVESTVGIGTKFHVYLPACDVSEAKRPSPPPAAPGRGERVLFVDDEVSVGHFVSRRLEQMNYKVSLFNDPLQALAAVRANPDDYDVIVSDFAMPGLNGLELVGRVRAIREKIPVIIVTGNRAALPPIALASMPYIEVVDKPFTGDDVALALQRVFGSRE